MKSHKILVHSVNFYSPLSENKNVIWMLSKWAEIFSVWAVEKEKGFFICPKLIKEFVDSEFEIGETIWWIHY